MTERCEDGWLKGTNRNKKSGVFPGNYLIPLTRTNLIDLNLMGNTSRVGISSGNSSTQHGPHSIPGSSALHPHQYHQNPPKLPPRNNSSPSTSLATLQSVWSKPVDALFNRKTNQQQVNSLMIKGDKEIGSGANVGAVGKDKKESLIKRFTNMKRSKSPTSTSTGTTTITTSLSSSSPGPPQSSYSIDNPVFDADSVLPTTSSKYQQQQQHTIQVATAHPIHVRSGSCPSQLLQNLPLDLSGYGPKRVKNQGGKERPSIQE